MKKVTFLLAAILVLGVSNFAKAQNNGDGRSANHDVKVGISKHSLVGVSSTSTIVLEPAAPTVAGEGLDFDVQSATDNSVWLQYSSIIGGNANNISVSMAGDALPTGVYIELTAANDAGKGKGQVGNSHGRKIKLSNSPQEFISEIRNCYTGTGSNAGHQLTYTLKVESNVNYQNLSSGDFTNTITYTITAN